MRLTLASLLLLVPVRALAAPVTIAAGETYSLDSGDVVLNGADTLDANGTAQNPCTIVGNGHAIVAHDLTAHVKITNCILRGLGHPVRRIVELHRNIRRRSSPYPVTETAIPRDVQWATRVDRGTALSIGFPDYLTTGVHDSLGTPALSPGESVLGTITFLTPEAYPRSLDVGDVVEISEGSRAVGHARIRRVLNPLLQRERRRRILASVRLFELTERLLADLREHRQIRGPDDVMELYDAFILDPGLGPRSTVLSLARPSRGIASGTEAFPSHAQGSHRPCLAMRRRFCRSSDG